MVVRIKVRFRNILGVIHMVVRIKVRFRNILGVIHMVGGLN